MNKITILLTFFLILTLNSNCNLDVIKSSNIQSNSDTLLVGYFLDSLLIGNQIFPLEKDLSRFSEIIDDTLLLSFKLNDSSYLFFFNPQVNLEFLSSSYRNAQATSIIQDIYSKERRISNFVRIDYDSPYLTGFYTANDSLIVDTRDLKIFLEDETSKSIYSSYFSISDTLVNLSPYFAINAELKNVLNKVFLPTSLDFESENFNLILLYAISSIQNAWYNKSENIEFSEMSNFIILTIEEMKIKRIQFSDFEYLPLIFKKMSINTEDVHY